MQETKLNPNKAFQFCNFKMYSKDWITYRGGGIAIVIKRNLAHMEVNVSDIPAGLEAVAVVATLDKFEKMRLSLDIITPPPNIIDSDSFIYIFYATHNTNLRSVLSSKHPN